MDWVVRSGSVWHEWEAGNAPWSDVEKEREELKSLPSFDELLEYVKTADIPVAEFRRLLKLCDRKEWDEVGEGIAQLASKYIPAYRCFMEVEEGQMIQDGLRMRVGETDHIVERRKTYKGRKISAIDLGIELTLEVAQELRKLQEGEASEGIETFMVEAASRGKLAQAIRDFGEEGVILPPIVQNLLSTLQFVQIFNNLELLYLPLYFFVVTVKDRKPARLTRREFTYIRKTVQKLRDLGMLELTAQGIDSLEEGGVSGDIVLSLRKMVQVIEGLYDKVSTLDRTQESVSVLNTLIEGIANFVVSFENVIEVAEEANLPEIQIALRAIEREFARSTGDMPTFSTAVVKLSGQKIPLGLFPSEQVHQLKDMLELRLAELGGEGGQQGVEEQVEVSEEEEFKQEKAGDERTKGKSRTSTRKDSDV